MQTLEQAISKVVKFWSEKSFRTPLNQNNGDNSENGEISFLLMNQVALTAQSNVTDEKIKAFEDKLTELLLKSEPHERAWLDVDYHPCKMLSDAAQYAGLDDGCFPCKSSTHIGRDNIAQAKYQYGSQMVDL
jgi:hypothetical protein